MEHPQTLGNGRFVLEAQLGEGGMASVYRAWDQRLQVWRAIKILAPRFAGKRKLRTRFEGEAQAMAVLEHRNVLRVYDIGNEGGISYIVMELAEGGSLEQWTRIHGRMPARLAVQAILQVCDGITVAHEHGIIHRDIKPHNVLVGRDGVCRVADFGIARLQDTEDLTKTGAAMGTIGFTAPEQMEDAKHVDVRADVFSIGATLFSLLTTRPPLQLMAASQHDNALAGVPQVIRPILLKATAYEREARHLDVLALSHDLIAALEQLPPDPPDTPPLALPAGEPPAVPRAGATFDADSMPHPTLLPDGRTGSSGGPTLLPDGPFAAGRRPTLVAPPEDTTLAERPRPRHLVPYTMGQGEGPLPDDLYVEAAARDDGPREIGLAEEDRQHLRPEQGEEEEDEDGKEQHHEVDGLQGMLKEGWLFFTQVLVAILKFLGGPMRYAILPSFGIVAIFFLVATLGGMSLGQTRQAVEDSRAIYLAAITQEEALVWEIASGSETPQLIEVHWRDYQEAKTDAERLQKAEELTRMLDAQLTRQMAGATPEERRHHIALNRRLEALKTKEGFYRDAEKEWEAASETTAGQFALMLGLESPPGE